MLHDAIKLYNVEIGDTTFSNTPDEMLLQDINEVLLHNSFDVTTLQWTSPLGQAKGVGDKNFYEANWLVMVAVRTCDGKRKWSHPVFICGWSVLDIMTQVLNCTKAVQKPGYDVIAVGAWYKSDKRSFYMDDFIYGTLQPFTQEFRSKYGVVTRFQDIVHPIPPISIFMKSGYTPKLSYMPCSTCNYEIPENYKKDMDFITSPRWYHNIDELLNYIIAMNNNEVPHPMHICYTCDAENGFTCEQKTYGDVDIVQNGVPFIAWFGYPVGVVKFPRFIYFDSMMDLDLYMRSNDRLPDETFDGLWYQKTPYYFIQPRTDTVI